MPIGSSFGLPLQSAFELGLLEQAVVEVVVERALEASEPFVDLGWVGFDIPLSRSLITSAAAT